MKQMKRLVALVLCLVMSASMLLMNASAASYPLIFVDPDGYTNLVRQGSVARLAFTIWPEYHNEKYTVNIYKGSKVDQSKLVGSASDTIYNTDGTFTRDLTITWDTTGDECGVYTVEYYMSFYSLYSWHDAPNRYTAYVTVFAPGTIENKVLHTDIKAQIDGYPIRSYNIDGNTCIVVEDLMKYGFKVVYDNDKRTLHVDDENGPVTSNYTHVANTHPVGSKAMDVYTTDIRTFIKAAEYSGYSKVKSYNVDGLTLIKIDDLDEFGNVVWDGNARTISFWRA